MSQPNCSRNQVSLLRHVDQRVITMAMCRTIKDPTLWSCLKRGYIARNGRGEDAVLTLTPAGAVVLGDYTHNRAPQRKAAADLTERTEALLAAARMRIHRVA